MNLFAGLEKFGIKADNTTDLFEDEKKPAASADGGKTEARCWCYRGNESF